MGNYFIIYSIVFIIIINIIIGSLYVDDNIMETFVNDKKEHVCYSKKAGQIKADFRPCTIYLMKDQDICDKLDTLYQMSDMQLQILLNLNKDKPDMKQKYDQILYVKNNKHTIPLNSCKIELNKWKEINKYAYKNITSVYDYDKNTLSGLCFKDVTNEMDAADINSFNTQTLFEEECNGIDNINNDSNILYNSMKMKEPIDEKLLSTNGIICNDINVSQNIDPTLIFIKIKCYLQDSLLKCNDIALVSYDIKKNKMIEIEDQKLVQNYINQFFGYYLIDGNIIYGPLILKTTLYNILYNICGTIKFYSKKSEIYNFSLEQLNINDKKISIFDESLFEDIPESKKNNKKTDIFDDIYNSLNKSINTMVEENKEYNKQIEEYRNQISIIQKSYNDSELKKQNINNTSNYQYNNCNNKIVNIINKIDDMEIELATINEYISGEENNNYSYTLMPVSDPVKLNKYYEKRSILSNELIKMKNELNNKKDLCNSLKTVDGGVVDNENIEDLLIEIGILENKLNKNKNRHKNYSALKKKLNIKYTLGDFINMVKEGVVVNDMVEKELMKYVSNDDSIYIQLPFY